MAHLRSFKDFSHKLLINYRVCKEHSTGKKKGGSDSSHLNGVTAVNSSSNGTG